MLPSVANRTGALLLLVALNPFIQFRVVTHSRHLPGREGKKEGKKKGRKVEKKIRRGGKEGAEREGEEEDGEREHSSEYLLLVSARMTSLVSFPDH